MAVLRCCEQGGIDRRYIAQGKPIQDALVERFNGSVRGKLLNQSQLSSFAKAREKIIVWKNDFNRHRPHSSLGNLTPQEFAIRPNGDQGPN